jgi:hypothetical protein
MASEALFALKKTPELQGVNGIQHHRNVNVFVSLGDVFQKTTPASGDALGQLNPYV